MEAKQARNERIDLRVTSEFKNRVSEAAAAYGVSITTFISMSAMERADRILSDRKTVMLTDAMRNRFIEALKRPERTAPDSIMRARNRHEQIVQTPIE